MNLNVVFDVPARVAQGLINGSLERVGGVVRDSSTKQVVMWLQEGGSQASNALAQPPLAGIQALATASSLLSAANLGVSVAGFALVLQQLNQISDQIKSVEAKVDRANQKLDDGWLAKLKAGINACQNSVELQNPTLRIQMAGDAINMLHEARHYFNQQAIRSSSKAEAASADYVGLAFVALAAEVQAHLQLDEGDKAARTLRQGLEDLRPGLTQLMNAVLECSCHFMRPEFAGEVDLDLLLWLHNGFRRMQRDPGEPTMQLTASELFDRQRKKIGKVFQSTEDWHGEIPQVVVDTSNVPDWWLGPVNQGMDKTKRGRLVKEQLPEGLNKIVALVEVHDRVMAQVLQLEEMERLGLKPTVLKKQLLLPEGQAAAVVLDPRWISVEVPA
jgi:predicted transcriptional regulator